VARGAIVFAAWWSALTALWLLAAGALTRTELVAGLLAGAVSATSMLVVRHQRLFRFGFRARWLLDARAAPWQVLRDSVVVLAALARGPRSLWRERPFPAGGADAASAGRRAFHAWAGSLGPNTVVVDIDRDRDVALVHDLDPKRARNSIP
jgi:multisubunit Na+/H+ antiporter MnhE subunit